MSIVFAGTPENAAKTLEALIEAGTEVTLVVTRPDAPVGRKAVITASPVAQVAEKFGIRTLKSKSFDVETVAQIVDGGYKLGIVVAYGGLLKIDALSATELGWFNVHYSDLPKWRGASPVQSAILAGDTETAVSIFKLEEGLDSGPILLKVRTKIEPFETSGRLLDRLTQLGISGLLEVIPKLLSGTFHLVDQNEFEVTYAGKISRLDAKLDLTAYARSVENKVRAMNPEPGAWLLFAGQPFKIHEAREAIGVEIPIGVVTRVNGRILLGCGKSAVELLEVQPSGKSRMRAPDWYRGHSGTDLRFEIE